MYTPGGYETRHEDSGVVHQNSSEDNWERTPAETVPVSLGTDDHVSQHITVSTTLASVNEPETSEGSGDHDDILPVTLLTTPIPHLLGTLTSRRPVEMFRAVGKELEKVEQEGLEGEPSHIYTTSTEFNKSILTISVDGSHEVESSGARESSENWLSGTEHPYLNTEIITPSSMTDKQDLITNDENDENEDSTVNPFTGLEVTFLPAVTQTPDWQTVTSSTKPGEFRANVEFSGDGPFTTDDITTLGGSDFTEVPTEEQTEQTPITSEHTSVYTDPTATENTDNMEDENDVKTTPTPVTQHSRPTQRVLVRTGNISGKHILS